MNDAINKELIFKIYKQLTEAGCKKQTNNQKWAENQSRLFFPPEGDIQMAKRHMKRCLTSLITREMQVQTTMRYHLTPIGNTIIIKSTNYTCWKGCGEKGTQLGC